MKKHPKLAAYSYADVSTCHITKRDSEILGTVASNERAMSNRYGKPLCLTVARYEKGFFIPVGQDGWLDEIKRELRKADLSPAFIKLLRLCEKRGVYLLWLDADGIEVDGLPKFDW